jgi:hypothetical protein
LAFSLSHISFSHSSRDALALVLVEGCLVLVVLCLFLSQGFACIYVDFALGVKVLPLFFELIG